MESNGRFGLAVISFIALEIVLVSCVADYHDPHCGGRQVVVHLFEWKWTDIAAECERYLGPKGFCGVQVSPPMEHVIVTSDAHRPWWERYQPVSYKLTSRSGNEAEFTDMVTRCKNVGVRIYVDAVINHMAGLGRSGIGSAGSTFDSDAYDFPGVPFSKPNFNDRTKCQSHDGNVNNYNDPSNVRDCNLVGLTDLDGSQAYVQDKIAEYFNHLIDIGVAGFRVDAAKHMWPADLGAIQSKTKDLPEGGRPFFMLEVIDRNDGAIKVNEYFQEGYVTEFRYAQKVMEGSSDLGRLAGVYDPGWGMAPSEQALVFVDNHDTQRSHQTLTYKNGDAYKRAVAFTLAYDYGFTRIMSSYDFTTDIEGPPANADDSTKDVTINADGSCGNGWVCEHRWGPIGNMAQFRNSVAGTNVMNWKYENGVLSFSRGNKGFFAMSSHDFTITVNTGLPEGEYCDLISNCAIKIKVDKFGNADVKPASGSDPFVAIVTDGGSAPSPSFTTTGTGPNPTTSVIGPNPTTSVIGPNPTTSGPNPGSTLPPVVVTSGTADYKRTLILVEKWTSPGQDLFLRGGIDHGHRSGCTHVASTSACSIPIKHHQDGVTPHFDKVNAWSVGDNYLDWDGAEPNQGTYNGRRAEGTPAYWSTNNKANAAYSELNTYGDHYWIVDVEMDCSKTENGFFEIKAVVNGGWEGDIIQSAPCTGNGAAPAPYTSKNHFARCGYLNVFHFGSAACEISEF